jgi:hypothetical protein
MLAPRLMRISGKSWIGWVLARTGVRGNRSMLYYRVRGGSMRRLSPVANDGSPLLRGLTRVEPLNRH